MRARRGAPASRMTILITAANGTARIAPTTPRIDARDQHGDDRREGRQLDRPAVDDRVDDVVLELLVDQLDHEHRDRGRQCSTVSATATRITAAIVAPTCGIRSRNPVITPSTNGNGSPNAQADSPATVPGDDRDRDVADQRRGDRLDRLLDHRAPARLGRRRREAEQPVGDRRALHQQEQREERERDEREHRAEDAAGDAEQRRRPPPAARRRGPSARCGSCRRRPPVEMSSWKPSVCGQLVPVAGQLARRTRRSGPTPGRP